MDILLIQPPIRDFYLTSKRTIPYGLACIASALKASGYSVGILDGLAVGKSRPVPLPPEMSYLKDFYGRADISPFRLFHEFRHFGYSYEHLKKQIQESGAFLVGISSLFSAYAYEALKIADLVRVALPKAKIVLGGHHPTALPERVMSYPSVDYLIRGEGEVAMHILAEAVASGREVSNVPGIVFRKPEGGLHIGSPAVMEEIDTYPLPDRTLIKNSYYTRGPKPATVIVTARGCPLGCSYCALGNRTLYPYRQRRVSSVLAEISEAVDTFGARFIDFEDENLSFNRKWFLKMLKGIIDRFGSNRLELRAMNGLFPPTLDEEVVGTMKEAGFKSLNLSLGSACPIQLKRFRRPDVREAFDRALLFAEKFSLDAVGYVIAGAPGQNASKSLDDLFYLARRRVLVGLSVFYPAPGSRDYENASELELLPKEISLFRASTLPISHTTSRIESVTLMRLARIINFIKELIDQGRTIPAPMEFTPKKISLDLDRMKTGECLLSGFLNDGKIRGVTVGDEVYQHLVDETLTREFLSRLKHITVIGTRRRPVGNSTYYSEELHT